MNVAVRFFSPPPTRFGRPSLQAKGAPGPMAGCHAAQMPPPVRFGAMQGATVQRAEFKMPAPPKKRVVSSKAKLVRLLKEVLNSIGMSDIHIQTAIQGELKESQVTAKSYPCIETLEQEQVNISNRLQSGLVQLGAVSYATIAEQRSVQLGVRIAGRPGDEHRYDLQNLGDCAVATEDLNAFFDHVAAGTFKGDKALVNMLRLIKRLS
jgi:hypothetical protein